MPRLPIPGQDNNTWGDILNEYLLVSHGADGTIKSSAVTSSHIRDNAVTFGKLSQSLQNDIQTLIDTAGGSGAGQDGADGREIELNATATHLQWRYAATGSTPATAWTNLVALADIRGPQGVQGDDGAKGDKGDKGDDGEQGLQGVPGVAGAAGPKGDKGDKGDPGEKGDPGAAGAPGMKGDKGDQGEKGDPGAQGQQGEKGDKGDKGDPGEQGPQGSAGIQGEKGDRGDKGDPGDIGPAGEKGDQGEQGIQGIQGLPGTPGDKGDRGDQGEKGDKGDTGATGAKGDKGDTGAQGVQGIQGEQGLQGIQGIPGAQGVKGDTGAQGDPGVVQSVNGQSVANVVLDHTDVGADQAGAAAAAQAAAELHADIAVSNLNQSLGSAAFSDDSDFATAAQGALADTAVQIESDPTVPSWAKVGTQPFETGAQVNTVTSVNARTGAVTGLAEASDLTAHTANTSNPHSVTKAQVGLGNVDNTSDVNKPVSTAQAAADATKVNKAGDTMTGTLTVPQINMSGGPRYITGTGFPNGVVSAPVGSIYIDTAATNGASSWIKKSGTGNTGWEVLEGDTGWRNITSLASSVFTVVNPLDTGLLIRRINNQTFISVRASTVATNEVTASFPAGFGTSAGSVGQILELRNVSRSAQLFITNTLMYLSGSTIPAGTRVISQYSYITTDPWPTILP